jgi:hypothetical protein
VSVKSRAAWAKNSSPTSALTTGKLIASAASSAVIIVLRWMRSLAAAATSLSAIRVAIDAASPLSSIAANSR